MGMMSVTLLAQDREDFDEIRAEAKRRMNEFSGYSCCTYLHITLILNILHKYPETFIL